MEESNPELTKSSVDDDASSIKHQEYAFAGEDIDDSIEETATGKTVWLIACTVSMGGFLFGPSQLFILPFSTGD